MTQRARLIHGEMRGWKAQHLAVFSQIAKLMNDVPGAPQSAPASTRAADFQHDLALLAGTLPDALAIGIRDEKQREIATYAANENARRALEDFQAGQRAPGAESANRLPGDFIYSFWSAPDERLAQGASGTLHQAFRVPIRDASGAFRGHVFALVSRDELQSILNRELLGSNEKATIVDRSNRVLASTRAGQTPFSVLSFDASRAEKGRVVAVDPNTFQLFPAADSPPITRWKNSSLIHVIAARDSAWKIVVEAPFAAQQRRLQELYFNNLALMLALCIAALFLASLVSRALTKPLSELARVTHNLPQRLMSDAALESIRWPDSRLDQMQALIGNFKEMSFNLRANFRDVASTRARLEEEQARLQEASRLKDEFLAIVSHELRTPLVPVIGYADLLARGMLKNEEDRIEATRAIERNARIQLRLIEDLLDVSRSAAGQMRIEVEPVELAEVVRESVANVQLAAQAKEIEILCEIAPDVPPISGDRSRLAQVMWNLLTNALKFTPPGGRVHVVLSREEKCAVIAVRDDGRGIDADFLPHVFARFRQAGSHLTRQEGGMGLGLSIVHDIVQLHGGTIEAHSDGEGRGAAFIVKFPLHATPQSPENPGASFNLSA